MSKNICIIGASNSLNNKLIDYFIEQNFVVHFITLDENDLANPIYKRALNDIKVYLYKDINIEKILQSGSIVINTLLAPHSRGINHKLKEKLKFSNKVATLLGSGQKLIQLLPAVSERTLFFRNFKSLITNIMSKKIKSNIVYLSPLVMVEDSITGDLYRATRLFSKRIKVGNKLKFSLNTDDFFIKQLPIILERAILGGKESYLVSKEQVNLDMLNQSMLKMSKLQLKKCKMCFRMVKILNGVLKLNLDTINGNYYKCLQNSSKVSYDKNQDVYKESLDVDIITAKMLVTR